MTKIKKPIDRETSVIVKGRPLCIRITPTMILVREKGRREWLGVGIDAVYSMACKMNAEYLKQERRRGAK